MLILVTTSALALALTAKSTVAGSTVRAPQFWLLATENMPTIRDGQFLISELLEYPNWNNSTEYTSYIHLLSQYTSEEVDDQIRPYLCGYPSRSNVENEIKSFLAQAVFGDIVIFYIECHGVGGSLWDPRITYSELANWLCSGGLQYAFVTVILETCDSGSSIGDGEGGVLGPNRNVLCACRSSESASGWCGGWHGFSHFITEGFALCGDGNNDGWVSAAEVFEYAKPRTEDWTEGQHPVSYYGQVEGDIPLVQRDTARPFPLWDVAVTHVETSTNVVLARSLVTVTLTLENQGIKTCTPIISVHYDSILALNQQVRLNPGETDTFSLVWNTTGILEGLYSVSVTASPGPGETDVADNMLVADSLQVYNAVIDIQPEDLKLRSDGARITCYIELPAVFAPSIFEIDTFSVKMGTVSAESLYAIGDFDRDGAPELMVKFDREAVVSYILSIGTEGYINGFNRRVTLKVTGRLYSGTAFEGYDTIKVTFHPLWQVIR